MVKPRGRCYEKVKPKPLPCAICGDMIRCPQERPNTGLVICEDCYHPLRRFSVGNGRESGEAADRQYHGGMFYSGEW